MQGVYVAHLAWLQCEGYWGGNRSRGGVVGGGERGGGVEEGLLGGGGERERGVEEGLLGRVGVLLRGCWVLGLREVWVRRGLGGIGRGLGGVGIGRGLVVREERLLRGWLLLVGLFGLCLLKSVYYLCANSVC